MKAFLLLFLLPLTALAQTDTLGPNDLRDRAFRMAKATVEFLATDAKLYGYPNKKTCPDCVSYAQLKAFIKEQKLTKADELVNDTERWAGSASTTGKTASAALAELRTELINRVTASAERQYRRSLPSFAAYEQQMNALAGAGGAEEQPSLAMNAGQPQTDAPDATADNQAAQMDTAYQGEEEMMASAPAQQTDNGWLSKSGLALILSLIGLAIAGWVLFIHRRGNAAKPAETTDDMRVARLNDELHHVKGDLRQTILNNDKLKARIEQLEGQVAVLQKAVGVTAVVPPVASAAVRDTQPAANPAPVQRQQGQSAVQASPVNPTPADRPVQQVPPATPAQPALAENRPRTTNPVPTNSAPQSQSVNPAPARQQGEPASQLASQQPKTLYARTVDLGDGFSADSLSEKTSERPMIYQLQISGPNLATFRVADDPYAQRLALSDPYSYLNDACEYTSQPASNSRIQTTRPGRLVLQGNKWVIQEKAQIAFS